MGVGIHIHRVGGWRNHHSAAGTAVVLMLMGVGMMTHPCCIHIHLGWTWVVVQLLDIHHGIVWWVGMDIAVVDAEMGIAAHIHLLWVCCSVGTGCIHIHLGWMLAAETGDV